VEVLVIGLGSIGLRHSKNLKNLGIKNIIGIDPNENMRKRFENEIGNITLKSLEDLPQDKKPNLTVISSPSIYHIEHALFAAHLGSHLFIEKPLSTSMRNVEKLQEIVESKKLFAHIGSNFKFHPALIKIKSILDKEALGKIVSAQVLAGQWLPDWHPNEDYRLGYSANKELGGGIILDTHEFDYITWLLGPVKNIIGLSSISGVLDIDTEDVACACIEFHSGTICTIQVDYIQRSYKKVYTLSGHLGTIDWDFIKGSLDIYDAKKEQTKHIDYKSELINDMYVEQMKHVIDGVKNSVEPVTSLRHAIETLKLQIKLKLNNA
jgi:predicted dehydrogenase